MSERHQLICACNRVTVPDETTKVYSGSVAHAYNDCKTYSEETIREETTPRTDEE